MAATAKSRARSSRSCVRSPRWSKGISIDEAFLDVSGLRLHYPSAEEIGATIRSAIRSEVGIPSSVGIATTKFIAKLASKHAKPDGLLRIVAGTELDFLHPLDVAELWGVGEATRASLSESRDPDHRRCCSHTDRPARGKGRMRRCRAPLGAVERTTIHDRSRAGRLRGLSRPKVRSSAISSTSDVIERETLRLCDQVAARLATSHLSGHTITLKVRFGDFSTINRSSRRPVPVAHTDRYLGHRGRSACQSRHRR